MAEAREPDRSGLEETINSLASRKQVIEILGRLLAEPEFRVRFLADPDSALAAYDLDEEERVALRGLAAERSISALKQLEKRLLT